ncbi:LACTB [Branchiostoma lanceolatum]|uniref:LACTB protein n=1 Tax=Branchiostoma lanceolatum TaxID=7740 RepID=A0A8K0A6D6_BRALA|nr:LACTB [Branchiostoma lanceolatum]
MAETFVVLLTMLAAVLSPSAVAAATLGEELADLDNFIQTLVACRSDSVPGLTISVVKNGQVVFAKGYGRRDSNQRLPVNNETLFGVASVTKSFTVALLADILAEKGDVTWDTPLVNILGEDFRFQDEFRTKEATLRDLLAHTMGLQKFPKDVLQFGTAVDRTEAARRIRYYSEVHPFRTAFYYSNVLYTLAGHVAERLAGKPYEQLLRERIFLPLGMSDTTFLSEALEEDNFSNFAESYGVYNKDGRSLPVNREIYRIMKLLAPAGGVVSNAGDMARYMQYHLRPAGAGPDGEPNDLLREAHTVQFLSNPEGEEKGREIFRPQFPVGVMDKGEGLGLIVGNYRGYRRLHHVGRLFGFTSLMTLFPDQSGGVFTSVNGPVFRLDRDVHRVLHYRVADMLLGLDPWLNTTTACSYPHPWDTRPADPLPAPPATSRDFPRDKRDYVGSYGNQVFGNLTIFLNSADGTLRFTAGLLGRGVILSLNATNSVLLKGPPDMFAPVQVFYEEEGGAIHRLVVPGVPPEPAVVYKRGLKLTDEEGSHREGGDTSGSVSGAETTVYGARSYRPLLAVFLLAFAFI